MSHDQYTQRHGPDASLPGRACFIFFWFSIPQTTFNLAEVGFEFGIVDFRCDDSQNHRAESRLSAHSHRLPVSAKVHYRSYDDALRASPRPDLFAALYEQRVLPL